MLSLIVCVCVCVCSPVNMLRKTLKYAIVSGVLRLEILRTQLQQPKTAINQKDKARKQILFYTAALRYV
jgi:hypothetical protein